MDRNYEFILNFEFLIHCCLDDLDFLLERNMDALSFSVIVQMVDCLMAGHLLDVILLTLGLATKQLVPAALICEIVAISYRMKIF